MAFSYLPTIDTSKNNIWGKSGRFEGYNCENTRKLICPHNHHVTWVDNTQSLSKLLNLYKKLESSGIELAKITKTGLCLFSRKYYILYKHPNNCITLEAKDIRAKNNLNHLKQIDSTFGKCKIGHLVNENKLIILNLKLCSRKKKNVVTNKDTE